MEDRKLTESTLKQLTEIHNQIKAADSGIRVLFTDSTGTGKTLAASWLSTKTGYPLYRVDLAAIANKYIGETEKNLTELFGSSEKSKTILLFDEADALFGKRTDVKDAHDRYANIETSYLLQRLEDYKGMVILTTNLKENIDETFLPAMNYIVDLQPIRKPSLSPWQKFMGWVRLLFR